MNHNFVPSPKMCYFCKVILKPALKACPTTKILPKEADKVILLLPLCMREMSCRWHGFAK